MKYKVAVKDILGEVWTYELDEDRYFRFTEAMFDKRVVCVGKQGTHIDSPEVYVNLDKMMTVFVRVVEDEVRDE